MRQGTEARGQVKDLVAVAHPHGERGRQGVEERAVVVVAVQQGVAVLPMGAWDNPAAKLVRQGLKAVADAQRR